MAALLLVVVLAAGCSVLSTRSALGDAGYEVSAISTNTSDATTTVSVVATAPVGLSHEAALAGAQRIVWQTQQSPLDRLEIDLDGQPSSADHAALTAQFGLRNPSLDQSRVDEYLLVGVFVVLGVAVLAAVVVAVLLARRARRRFGPGGPTPDPAWQATAVIGPRTGQFVLDYLLWYIPTLAGMFAVVGIAAATSFDEPPPDAFPVGVLVAGGVWLLASVVWGWLVCAYWPARHGGQTPGMRAVGLQILSVDGNQVGLGRHSLRWLLLLVEASLYGLPALITMAATRRHQRFGDLAAGTVVVRRTPPLETTPSLSARYPSVGPW